MRRIRRSDAIPPLLTSERVRAIRSDLLRELRRPLEDRRQRRAPINDEIFYDEGLIARLNAVFHSKCAYCESPVSRVLARHFRPLSLAVASRHQGNHQDYYAWLAYEWLNMLVACDWCEKSKGDRFPVWGQRASYLSRFDDVREQENAVLIDPVYDDPRRHIQFLADGSCIHRTERAAATIATFDLNRTKLVEDRAAITAECFAFLRSSKGELRYGDIDRQFALNTPHVGAALDVLRRLVVTWRGASRRDVAERSGFLRNVVREMNEARNSRRNDLLICIDEIETTDRERGPAMRQATAAVVVEVDEIVNVRSTLAMPPAHDREIDTVQIFNFKGIDKLQISLPPGRLRSSGAPCLIILGENSTGKSTLLSAIAIALIGQSQARRLKLRKSSLISSDGIDRWNQFDAKPAKASVSFHAFSGEAASFEIDPETGGIKGSAMPSSIVLGYGPRRYFSSRHRHRPKGAAQRVRSLFDPVSIIPYPNDWLANLDGEKFDTVARALRIVFALNDEDRLVNDPEDGMCVEAAGRRIPVEWLSEGYRSIFAMVVDIFRELLDHYDSIEEAQAVVLIDEIETHLHPRWKMQVMTSLRRALPRVQFIVTTHDPLCLRGIDNDEVVVLQRTSDNKIRRLEDLPSIKGMTAEQLLTSDYFGLAMTTDPGVDLALARATSDVVFVDDTGNREVQLSEATSALIGSLSIGDSQSEIVLREALERYLADREFERGSLRSDIREDAIEEIYQALASIAPTPV